VNVVLNGAVATTDVIANCLNPIFPPYCSTTDYWILRYWFCVSTERLA